MQYYERLLFVYLLVLVVTYYSAVI